MRIPALLLALFLVVIISGCRAVMVVPATSHSTVTHTRHIHPPHAPAHGYRHHYHSHDMEYDSSLGAYIVLGYDGFYFYNNFYLRFYAGNWQIADRLDGGWRHAEHHHVPGGLRGHKRYKRHKRDVPPPHAPAHGHRHHHHHGVDLEFDTDLGAYLVLGFDGLYFFNNFYMRFFDGYWHIADRHDGHWRRAEHHHIPRGLRRHKRYIRHLRHTPPPPAPTHGHRHHHHHGLDLVFDSGVGAYIVLGFDDLFFFDNHYMRYRDGSWYRSDRHDGHWRRAEDRHVPHKLRKARRQEKQELIKRLKKQYRKDHQEEREYRERRHRRSSPSDQERRSRSDNGEKKKGFPQKVKKKHESREDRENNNRSKRRDRDQDEDDENSRNRRNNHRGNGNRH